MCFFANTTKLDDSDNKTEAKTPATPVSRLNLIDE
jgi:hypothetical protein